jgi:hypothetical protein
MDKFFAEELMLKLNELGQAMNIIAHKIEELNNEPEKIILRGGIADLMGGLYSGLICPVIKKYPELDPDAKSK